MRRWGVLAVAVAAVAALGGGACIGGDGGGDDDAFETPATTLPPTPEVTQPPAVGPEADPETFEVFTTKNPFTPLVGAPGTPAPTPGTPVTPGAPGDGTGTTTPDGQPVDGGESSPGRPTEPQVAQRVALLDVFAEGGEPVANVRVNSTVHEVSVGEEFAGRYKVLSLSQADDCGRFLFGDEPFRLCKGQQVLK